jgi:hypothetical protein
MAKAITARRKGDDYQARVFWCNLLELRTGDYVSSVTLESDCVSFVDDVVVTYNPPIKDSATGWEIHCDLQQCKCHVTANGAFTWQNLLDPEFIHSKESLLTRLFKAYQQMTAQSKQGRFLLSVVSNWKWHPDDDLSQHVAESAIRETFFSGGPKSSNGKIRSEWAAHLGIPEAELKPFLETVRFRLGVEPDGWHGHLQPLLKLAGLTACDLGHSACVYDDLTWKLFGQGRNAFDRKTFDEMIRSEKLLAPQSGDHSEISICSRPEFARRPRDLQALHLDLCDLFDGRFPRLMSAWTTDIPERALVFVKSEAFTALPQPVHVFFDCHLTVAFLMGHLIDPKYSVQAIPAQKTRQSGYELWAEPQVCSAGPLWNITRSGSDNSSEAVVGISVTNPIERHLAYFLGTAGLDSALRIDFSPVNGVGPRAVTDGAYAWSMGYELQRVLREVLPANCRKVHLFFSGPAALSYILGNALRYIAPSVQLYEYDFEGDTVEHRYFPSICLATKR